MSSDDRDDRIGRSLRGLGQEEHAPPPGLALQAELARIAPVRTRRPGRQFAAVSAVSLVYGTLLVLLTHVRPDLSGLPVPWLVLYCAAWLASFLVITWLTLVPGPRRVMPSWRHAGIGALVASLGFVLAGLLLDRHGPTSVVREPTLPNLLHGSKCLIVGGLTALVPIALSALLLRGSLPVGSRWAGAGVGAAGGSLGGLMLHLHCPVADALHLGVVHGGLVVIGTLAGALAVPRLTRT
jgi:hypothetical protein